MAKEELEEQKKEKKKILKSPKESKYSGQTNNSPIRDENDSSYDKPEKKVSILDVIRETHRSKEADEKADESLEIIKPKSANLEYELSKILSNYLIHEDQPEKTKNFINEFAAKINPEYAEDLGDELELLKEQHSKELGHEFSSEEDKNKHFIDSISRFLLKSFNHDIKLKNKKMSKYIKLVDPNVS